MSMNSMANDTKASLIENDVDIHPSTCTVHLKVALENGGVGVSPQKPSDVH